MARRSADRRETATGEDPIDLGRSGDYGAFLRELQVFFGQALNTQAQCYCVTVGGPRKKTYFTLAHDLAAALRQAGFMLDDIIIWDGAMNTQPSPPRLSFRFSGK